MTYAVNVASLGSNGGTSISTWTTGTRPSSPLTGQFGFNTTLGSLEVYNGTAWATAGGLNTQSVQTTGFTAVAGNSYPCNTTSAAFTVTLPASPTAGNQIQIIDYAGTFATNNITLGRNGSNITGAAINYVLNVNRESVILTYVDSTQGWIVSSAAYTTSPLAVPTYSLEYLIIAGGGGATGDRAGGGGAGGVLSSTFTASSGTGYSLTVGAGGSGWANGSNSTGFSVTAVGGGRGGDGASVAGQAGGSGGGGGNASNGSSNAGGAGTSGQGNAGGSGVYSAPNYGSGGGGGAGGVGGNGTSSNSGNGGVGTSTYSAWGAATSTGQNSGGTYYYAGGGGGGLYAGGGGGAAGLGGGGAGSNGSNGGVGTANTGGGAGGGNANGANTNGGSGIVIVRYSGAQRGTGGTVVTTGGYTYHTFTSSGTYTA